MPIDAADKKNFTDDQIAQIQASLGMAKVNVGPLRGLRQYGLLAKELGVLEVIKGSFLISQEGLVKAIIKLSDAVENETDKEELKSLSKALGYLTGHLSKVNTSSVKVDATVADYVVLKDKMRRQSAKPGQKIGVIDV